MRADHHVAEPAQIVFHRAHLAQRVERAHHEEGVAQPAVAVVPVALAARRLGDAGGHGGHDGAGVLVQRELERDGRADHRVLVLEGNGQALAPGAPVGDGFLLELARGVGDAFEQRLVHAEHEVVLARDHEGLARQDVRDRRVGVQPQGHVGPDIADVVAAARDLGRRRGAPLEARVERHADARRAGNGAHAAHHHERTEVARAAVKARREIGDLDALPRAVEQLRAQHGGVGLVPLLAGGEVLDLDGPGAGLLAGVQQRVEDRVAVEARQAAPDGAGARIDERAVGAVADHADIERRLGRRREAARRGCRHFRGVDGRLVVGARRAGQGVARAVLRSLRQLLFAHAGLLGGVWGWSGAASRSRACTSHS
ncbi:hypothetical protein D9M68_409920 [compost metagenome]